jgi:transcriptional regulator with XRE-family HTH domain
MQTKSFQTFQKQLGARLGGIRKSCGYSQEYVGNLLKMHRVSIGYIEQGKRAPQLSTLYALAQIYKVDIREFFELDQ